MDTTTAVCVACHRTIPAWDTPRWACQSCQQQAATQLAALPGLYAVLDPRLGQGAPSVGSRHAAAGSRPPCRLDVLDLTGRSGTVLPMLTGWVRDWAEQREEEGPDWPAGEQGQVTEACRYLRWRLDWACRKHPAVDEALGELGTVYRQVLAAATGDRGERRVGVACRCGVVLRVTVSCGGAACGGCGARYGRAEVMALPLAGRGVAA